MSLLHELAFKGEKLVFKKQQIINSFKKSLVHHFFNLLFHITLVQLKILQTSDPLKTRNLQLYLEHWMKEAGVGTILVSQAQTASLHMQIFATPTRTNTARL